LMPLWNIRWSYRDEGRLNAFKEYRGRLENVVSYIAFSIRESGIADSYDCKTDNDKLCLLITGSDIEKMRSELEIYLKLFKMPSGSTMALFNGESPDPEEISL
jgi:hypothetical protein